MRLARIVRKTCVAAAVIGTTAGCSEPHSYQPPAGSYTMQALDLADSAGVPQRVRAASVSSAFFSQDSTVRPLLGRLLLPADYTTGSSHVVVLSRHLWERRFGAHPQIIGHTIRLDGQPTTVVGVMPADFDVPVGVDLWVPKSDGAAAR